LFLGADMVANGPSGGLMLDGDLPAYCSMAIGPFTGLFLVAIHIRRGPVNTLPTEEDCKSGRFPRHLDPIADGRLASAPLTWDFDGTLAN
jgi:hypothetical protein